DPTYARFIELIAASEPWRGKVDFRGFCEPEEVAAILAAADAVVLPFREGGGGWNSSLLAAHRQGTLVVTTSNEAPAYDPATNIATAPPDDVEALTTALNTYCGARRNVNSDAVDDWVRIAEAHARVYSGTASQ